MNKSVLCVIGLVLIASAHSCSKNNGSSYAAKAVVEAYLQPGQKAAVKITREILTGEDTAGDHTISGLSVIITYNGTSYPLSQNSSGIYENTGLPITAGSNYELIFSYNGNVVTATALIPNKPINFTCTPTTVTIPTFGSGGPGGPPTIPDPLKAKWDNPEGAYHLFVIKSLDSGATEISNFGGGGAARGFINAPDQSDNKEINFRNFEYYGRNALILYRIQPELAFLYNSGSTNSQNLNSTPTNVNNGLGIFTGVNIADTIFVSVN